MFEQPDQLRLAPLAVSFSDTGRSVAQIDKNFLKAAETIGNPPCRTATVRVSKDQEKRLSLFGIML
jgi:hypothetical protein